MSFEGKANRQPMLRKKSDEVYQALKDAGLPLPDDVKEKLQALLSAIFALLQSLLNALMGCFHLGPTPAPQAVSASIHQVATDDSKKSQRRRARSRRKVAAHLQSHCGWDDEQTTLANDIILSVGRKTRESDLRALRMEGSFDDIDGDEEDED